MAKYLITTGSKVKFVIPELAQQFGDDFFIVAEVERHTGGIRLEGLEGTTFAPESLASNETLEAAPFEPNRGAQRVSPAREGAKADPEQIAAIQRLLDSLGAPMLAALESGFKERSFYRFPCGEACFCGKPYRYTLDGWRCEEGHRKEAI